MFDPAAASRASVAGLAQQRVTVASVAPGAAALGTHVFRITDGKSVKEKLEELNAMPGAVPPRLIAALYIPNACP